MDASLGMNSKTTHKQLAVLGYHKIGEPSDKGWDTWNYIPQTVFVEQMEFIRDGNWTAIDLTTFLNGMERPGIMPERSVMLTFDDGYKSMRDIALPILQQFGFSAICFVPTDYIGTLNTFDTGIEPEEPMCDWDDLRELEQNNVAIQSHGVSHDWLSQMNPQRQQREVVQSKQVLEKGLGKPIEVFAFPYGDSGKKEDNVNDILRQAGYRAAVLFGESRLNDLPIHKPFRIDRLAMYRDTDLRTVLS